MTWLPVEGAGTVCECLVRSATSAAVATMPDRGGLRAVHRLCDSVCGANWRPTRFEDESMLSRLACCVCHVIPSTTVMLPCSHLLCEQCLTGSVRQDGERVCPLDVQPFSEDECQRLKLHSKTKRNLKAHCWNEDHGCEFVGTIEDVLLHYDRECAFHAVQCPRCGGRTLRTDLAAHYLAGCSESVPSAGDSPKNRQGCEASAMQQQLPNIQRRVNELPRLRIRSYCRTSGERSLTWKAVACVG
ncbi:hypothetical protein HPB50_004381 [Hyalomma asiaticum]|uniref:Uncharacterized protein n=1 Tax=Hyalomma asiaticum TaxID=266040 RepID=A0ACB7RIZ2_HYAAI|nr:hypothetical protein HPB50_004381 [Hyalomma asiaticum]